MQIDRDLNKSGLGKYALVNLRRLMEPLDRDDEGSSLPPEITQALVTLENAGVLEWGKTHEKDEFFVIKLRDENASYALKAYASAVARKDPQFADSVNELARRSGLANPFCKWPD